MRATLRLARRAAYADYLAAEDHSPTRHEYLDGVIVAMPGGSDEHNAIAIKLGALRTQPAPGSRRPPARWPRSCR